MTITVAHQQRAQIDPVHTIAIDGTFDAVEALHRTITAPMLTPATPGTDVVVTDSSGQDITDQVGDILLSCLWEGINPDGEEVIKAIAAQSLRGIDSEPTVPVAELLAAQAAGRHHLPGPSTDVIYTTREDVIPAAKALLKGSGDADLFFASLDYTHNPRTLGIWFTSEAEFDACKTWIASQVAALGSVLPGPTKNLFDDFATLSLKKLTQSIRLRHNTEANNQPYSFARVLAHLLMRYVDSQGSGSAGVLPFDLTELFCPTSLVFVNVEAHANTPAAKIDFEWQLINRSIALPVKTLSLRKIQKLTALQRSVTRARGMASRPIAGQPGSRAMKVRLLDKRPAPVKVLTDTCRVLAHMGQVAKSHNIVRVPRRSFAKANRRDPDNFNLPGKIQAARYMPDLHIYLDTSGSISQRHYQSMVMMLIRLAKKLDVNLYISSFSHFLSEETLLRVRGRSVKAIWRDFEAIPKVTGRTDFEQIWHNINADPARQRRFNLVVTDFMWWPPSVRVEHPKNLFYAPCAAFDWDLILEAVRDFNQRMQHIEPAIAERLIGLVR